MRFEEYRLNSMFNEIRTMSQTPNASMDFDSIPMSVGEKRRKVEQIRHNYSRELDAEVIKPEKMLPLCIGANIGTTITPILAVNCAEKK